MAVVVVEWMSRRIESKRDERDSCDECILKVICLVLMSVRLSCRVGCEDEMIVVIVEVCLSTEYPIARGWFVR